MIWLLIPIGVVALILFCTFYGWISGRDHERSKQPPSAACPCACPCGCARVGKFCARCGRSPNEFNLVPSCDLKKPPAWYVKKSDGSWYSLNRFGPSPIPPAPPFKPIVTPAPPPDKPWLSLADADRKIALMNHADVEAALTKALR